MIPIVIIAQVAAQYQAQSASPLMTQAQAIANSPSEVRYEFVKQAFPRFSTPRDAFQETPVGDQKQIVLKGYYTLALKRATLVYRGDPDLVAILNQIKDGSDLQAIALEFEAKYHSKFGKWPPIVPVDVDSLIERMLEERTIR